MKDELQSRALRVDILSLFPDYFSGPFDQSMIKQARKKGIIDIRLINIRDFSEDTYKRVDDRCYGGGPGMVLMAPPLTKAIQSVKSPKSHTIYLSPQGTPLTAQKCRELAQHEHLILLCGHYEGIDERVLQKEIDEEVSIGDYVLTSGCAAAIVLLDAVVRFVPGVLGHHDAASEDSFEKGILDCPHYTRPEIFDGLKVPEVLLSGNHQQVKEWRLSAALDKTRRTRPDLFIKYLWSQEESLKPVQKKQNRVLASKMSRLLLRVTHIKKSIQFYRDELRLKLLQEDETSAVFIFGEQELVLRKGLMPKTSEVAYPIFELRAESAEVFAEAMKRTENQTKSKSIIGCDHQVEAIEFIDPDGYLWYLKRPS